MARKKEEKKQRTKGRKEETKTDLALVCTVYSSLRHIGC